ncbi:Glucokinase [Candidatus Accumulibacter aalborgensis]|uniref:Glucokinase n=1 Tax=Candidatus Accumulibacter aalborgensis TaxID=1860102 RepID=A0A1A8XZK3_9PROT|nr:glucokinase [Candidatus Accumulibacter aalborgensis]SBT10156.1 Glucokinase [Candidatus Accumulibacter aalborgensis]
MNQQPTERHRRNVSAPELLVADIGGTHARFALLDERGAPQWARILTVADFAGPVEAIEAYLGEVGSPTLRAAALALAAPVHEQVIRMTNGAWIFARAEIRSRLGLTRLLLLNDFTALALSLPLLAAEDLHQVGGGKPVALAAKAVLGPGTGLGVSGVLFNRGHWLALTSEGGHCSLAATDRREAEILALAWRELGHVSAERLLSGSGLPLLHRLVAEVDGRRCEPWSTAEIVARAVSGEDLQCRVVIDTFCALLGGVAGNLALTLGAQGGVYVGGGIIPRLGEVFDRSAFRARFEAKGRFASYLAAIPTYVVLSPTPALLGSAHALTENEPSP